MPVIAISPLRTALDHHRAPRCQSTKPADRATTRSTGSPPGSDTHLSVARRLGGSGSVTGIDNNDGMLAIARRAPEEVTWRNSPAKRLPFLDQSFDRVVSQFALMFFADKAASVAEMARVTRPGGTITVATWASIDESPGYAAMVHLVQRLFGDEAATALMAPFTLGTEEKVDEVLGKALPDVTIARNEGVARFDSLEAWVHTDIRGWTLADMIDDE